MSRRREQSTTPNLLVQIGAALTGLFRLMVKPKPTMNHVQLLAEYMQLERLLESGDAVHAAQAVVRADSFLDGIMQRSGGQGASFADRLRSLERRFDRGLYQAVWDAHRLRNDLAHNHGRAVSVSEAGSAIQTFRRAASVLGAF